MTTPPPTPVRTAPARRPLASVLAAVTAVVVGTAALVASPAALPAAWAAASVSVTGPDGGATFSPDYATEVTVSGAGFQSIQNGFGGVYVLFGWVDDAAAGSWRPSAGGVVGADYRYVPDAESADNAGFQRFLAFAGSQTESSANGVLAADGSWSVGMVIPGATFESHDRDGNISTVDCRTVTCGIITIGAHGVKNANNETFTPVRFAAPAVPPAEPGSASADTPAPAAPGAVRVGVESTTVTAGTSAVFTGQGFTPGEQVVASLDGGVSAVGPLTAGAQGEVAAALPVPRDVRDGTHLITLRGAGSGAVAETEITVTGSILQTMDAAASAATPQWVLVVLLASILLALVLVITSVVTAIVRARRRRRARRAAAAPGPASTDAPPAATEVEAPTAPVAVAPTAPVAAASERPAEVVR